MLDQLKFRTQAMMNNWRQILDIDNALVHVINLVSLVAGAFLLTQDGALAMFFGALLLVGGSVGLADSIYARV